MAMEASASGGSTIGWDIGGVHTKAVRRGADGNLIARSRAFAIEHRLDSLVTLLEELKKDLGASPRDRHGVTMTAELSQLFRTKREGVERILEAVRTSLGEATSIFATDGRFLTIGEALTHPLLVAASNWAATARVVAELYPDALLIDIGSTTTDLIPIVGGKVAALGKTDPERLASAELVYSGVVRTPVEAVAAALPWRGEPTAVSAEGFALMGDVYLWLGQLGPEDYTTPTPDRRPATRPFAGERLARVICADREMLNDDDLTALARSAAQAQQERVAGSIRAVLGRHPSIRRVVVTGLGEFLGTTVARRAGLEVHSLGGHFGPEPARVAPAAAVAMLLSGTNATPLRERRGSDSATAARSGLTVIKVGGGILDVAGALERVAGAVAAASRTIRLVVIPGGGPFADAVRDVDGRLGLPPSAAHWMAILGMDQYAHALAAQIPGGEVVDGAPGIPEAHARGGVPVLAPYRWLRSANELPHTWAVTSDSLAAYLAGLLGAERLVLVKPRDGGMELTDDFFERTLPDGIRLDIIGPAQLERLQETLTG
jgi:hypothetical protein